MADSLVLLVLVTVVGVLSFAGMRLARFLYCKQPKLLTPIFLLLGFVATVLLVPVGAASFLVAKDSVRNEIEENLLLILILVSEALAFTAWGFIRLLYRKLPKLLATIAFLGSGAVGAFVVAGAVSLLAVGGGRSDRPAPPLAASPSAAASQSAAAAAAAAASQPAAADASGMVISSDGSVTDALAYGEAVVAGPFGDVSASTERDLYLADLARKQIRKIPVFVGWRDELPWGQQTPVVAIIASSDRAEAQTAISQAVTESHIDERAVAIGRKVRAELSGANVEIAKPEQTLRDVSSLRNVTFEWLVKPTRPGKTVLTLRIFNELIEPDGTTEIEHPALVHTMSVKIGVLDWLTWQMDRMKGLQWVIGGVLAGLGFAFANRARLRRWWKRRHPAKTGATAPPPAPPPPSPGP